MKRIPLDSIAIIWIVLAFLAACAGNSQPEESAANTLFRDNFESGELCFELFEMGNSRVAVMDGELMMETDSPDLQVWTTCDDLSVDDFILEVELRDDTDTEGFHYMGIILRSAVETDETDAISATEWYEVDFGFGEGFTPQFCVLYVTESTYEAFTESLYDDSCWVDIPIADLDPADVHQVRVEMDGPSIIIFFDNTFTGSFNDERIARGNFGLLAGTFTGPSVSAHFDNLTISQLAE